MIKYAQNQLKVVEEGWKSVLMFLGSVDEDSIGKIRPDKKNVGYKKHTKAS